jgi:hypothetical protein
MPLPLLNGEVVDSEAESQPLRDRIEQLEADLRKMRQERDKARSEGLSAISAVQALREQLSGLWRALRAIYGEIDLVAEPEPQVSPSLGRESVPSSPQTGRWQALMTKLGGLKAQFIQALLDFGPSTVTGIRAATGMSKQSVYNTANDLSKLGLITRKGSEYALRD